MAKKKKAEELMQSVTLPADVFADNVSVEEDAVLDAQSEPFVPVASPEAELEMLAKVMFEALEAKPWGSSIAEYTLVRKQKAEGVGIPLLTKAVNMDGFVGEATLVKVFGNK